MRQLGVLSAAIALIVSYARAGTVIDSNFTAVVDPSFPGAQYWFTVYQDEARTDPTSLFVGLNGELVTAVAWNVDEEADYYLVPNLAVFSAATISSGIFPPLFALDQPHTINVGFGDFYLGINTGQGFAGGQPSRNVFGWVHFVNNSQTGLQMIGNAVTYGNSGIIVGTTNVIPVPEPSIMALIAAGAVLLGPIAWRRGRHA